MASSDTSNTVYDYSSVHIRKLYGIVLSCFIIGLGLLGIVSSIIPPEEYENNWIMFVTLLVAMAIIYLPLTHVAVKMEDRRKICKALAGLQLSVIHCEDDIVVLMNLGRKTARRIIDGDYDYLLSDPYFCKFMPY